jgi:hypothetical protein
MDPRRLHQTLTPLLGLQADSHQIISFGFSLEPPDKLRRLLYLFVNNPRESDNRSKNLLAPKIPSRMKSFTFRKPALKSVDCKGCFT